ncbi:MAG TPA: hypothetical protein DD856_11720, partial [Sulfobacillus sp.]|nr:hypothetical protein [Sulfobacillus sp.]
MVEKFHPPILHKLPFYMHGSFAHDSRGEFLCGHAQLGSTIHKIVKQDFRAKMTDREDGPMGIGLMVLIAVA